MGVVFTLCVWLYKDSVSMLWFSVVLVIVDTLWFQVFEESLFLWDWSIGVLVYPVLDPQLNINYWIL